MPPGQPPNIPTQPPLKPEVRPDEKKAEQVKIPPLDFTRGPGSEKPINIEGGRERKIASVTPWKDFTIVALEGAGKLAIYDKNAKRIEEFDAISSTNFEVRPAEILQNLGKSCIALDGASNLYNPDTYAYIGEHLIARLSTLAPELRKVLEATYFADPKTIAIYKSTPSRNVEFKNPEVLGKGKYVYLKSDTPGFNIIYQTHNDAGAPLHPRNWIRIRPFKGDKIPADLQKYTAFEKQTGRLAEVNDGYIAVITPAEVRFFPVADPTRPAFTDKMPKVGTNFCVDKKTLKDAYYCTATNVRGITILHLSSDLSRWNPKLQEFPNGKQYEEVQNLRLDPGGNFFMFSCKDNLVFLAKDTLKEVGRVPEVTNAGFDEKGMVRAIKKGHFRTYEFNLAKISVVLEAERIAKLAARLQRPVVPEKKNAGVDAERLRPLKDGYVTVQRDRLAKVKTLDDASNFVVFMRAERVALANQKLTKEEVDYVLGDIEKAAEKKERELARTAAEKAIAEAELKMAKGITLPNMEEARAALEATRGIEGLLDDTLRQRLRKTTDTIGQRAREVFKQRGGEIIKEAQSIVSRSRAELESYASKGQMDDWLEFRFPQLKYRIENYMRECPIEAEDVYNALKARRDELDALAKTYQRTFQLKYEKVRSEAAKRLEEMVKSAKTDIKSLLERVNSKGFKDRSTAEKYIASSEARRMLEEQIKAIGAMDKNVGREFDRLIKVEISNLLISIEHGGRTKIAASGQQFIRLGNMLFPKWEGVVKERKPRTVDVTWVQDKRTAERVGDIALLVKSGDGGAEKVRLWENTDKEDEWRFGLMNMRGKSIPPSYMTAEEYNSGNPKKPDFKKDYSDWMRPKSKLKADYERLRKELHQSYKERKKVKKRTQDEDVKWAERYRKKLGELATFCAGHNISLLKRIDEVRREPDVEISNGGFIPTWQSHWTIDGQTEKYLENMGQLLKMQLDLQEGMLNLKGHAGTGKDVLVKMFCSEHLANRPYFSFDCSKWVTEADLSADLTLASESGATYAVEIPSSILKGIETPGAVVYLNEFNAMPEQAQIFLHALMDEKRSMTLKTKSGKVIKAHPSILLICSENPNYPGTFAPGFATKSRRVPLEITYPPLTRKADDKDRNRNDVYDASEPLRIARDVDSLSDLTLEANIQRNEFIKMWDRYVNGIDNGAASPKSEQKFDIDVILALVQFANKLRAEFVKTFEKSASSRPAFPVNQPITGRELRRCAYVLSRFKPEEKAKMDSEKTARELLERFWLSHIDKKEEQDKIKTAMATWTSSKRVVV